MRYAHTQNDKNEDGESSEGDVPRCPHGSRFLFKGYKYAAGNATSIVSLIATADDDEELLSL